MADTKTVTHRDSQVQSTIRIPRELSIRAKIIAAKTGYTVNQLFAEGLEIRVSQIEKRKAIRDAA